VTGFNRVWKAFLLLGRLPPDTLGIHLLWRCAFESAVWSAFVATLHELFAEAIKVVEAVHEREPTKPLGEK